MRSASPLVVLALLAACGPDTGITVHNSTPEAVILSHADGDVVDVGVPIELLGTVSDDSDGREELEVTWYDGATTLCEAAAPDASGQTSCMVTFDEGEHSVVLEVRDPHGASGTARATITATPPEVTNTAPICGITAPVDGARAQSGEVVVVAGVATDGETAPPDLTVLWTSDLDGVLDDTAADETGNIGFSTSALRDGAHQLSLLVTDPQGERCEEAVTVYVGDVPTVDIVLPEDGGRFGEGEQILFEAIVSSGSTAAEDLALVWESDLDGELDTSAADTDGVAGFLMTGLSPGAHTITLTAEDDAGLVGLDVLSVVINAMPTAPTVHISPDPASPVDDLVAILDVASVDPEGATVSYSYAWTVDGVDAGIADATVPASATEDGQVWAVTVTPNDGEIDGPSSTASVSVSNRAPVLVDVTLSPDPAYEGDTLTCAPGVATDADGDSISYDYAWTVNGGSIAETSATLSSGSFDKGDDVRCAVTPTDGTTAGSTVTSNTVTVANTAPAVSAVAIAPTNPSVSDTLTCGYTFSDADGDSDSSTVSWTINGAAAGTGPTLPTSFVGGDTITCTVTPYDGDDTGTAASAGVTVGNTAPELASVSLTPDPATESDTLTCTPGVATDADGDSISYSYAWRVNGLTLSATSTTLSASFFAKNDDVECLVTPADGGSTGTTVASNTVTIANSAPSASAVSISPSSPTASSTLTCSWTFADLDGDSDASTVVWKVNGTTVGTGATLSSGFGGGDSVSCTVTPYDGDDTGTAASTTVGIANSAPSLASASLSPTTAYEGDTLSCTPGTATDPDGDPVSYSYAWYVNGGSLGRTSTTLSSTYFDKDDAVSCGVTPTDGTDAGSAVRSNTVTIANSVPLVSGVSISPTSPTASSTLTCSWTFSDGDGDSDASTVVWKVNGTSVGTGTTLSGSFVGGDSVSCTVTPADGDDTGTASTRTVTIGNSAPTLASASLTPTTAYEGDTLTCTPGTASDVDGDTVSYSYVWTVSGASVSPTSATLSSSYFGRGDTVRCAVTPTDGTTSGTAVASNTVTISNSAPTISGVTLTPSSATTSSTLSVSYTTADVDGDTVSVSYQWTVNGTTVSTGSTLSGTTYFAKNDVVQVSVTPNDSTTSGTAGTASLTVSNTAPGAPDVAITPETADAGDEELLCYVVIDATDVDGDALTYTVSWEVDGLPYPSGVSGAVGPDTTEWADDTVPAADTDLGSSWTCTVTADDGDVEGTEATATAETLDFYDVGYSSGSYGPGLAGASYLLGPSITVSSATTVYELGALLNTAGNTGRLALYTNSSGAPGTLVAYTDTFVTALGANEVEVVTPTTISAGTYWVMAVYSASTYIYYGSTSTSTVKYKSASYSSTPSSSFGTASSYTGYPPAYYLVVAD